MPEVGNDEQPYYEVKRSADGKTLWVNGAVNCLGRYSANGCWEVYRRLSKADDLDGRTSTLATRKSEKKRPAEWNNFVMLVARHHDIDLTKEAEPV